VVLREPKDAEWIMGVLPHRPPFLLIDEVVELEEGRRVVAVKDVKVDEPYLAGHFPGNPLMPGVLIVEGMAQAGAVALLSSPENRGMVPLFAGINRVRFRRRVRPGERLVYEVELDRARSRVGRGRGVARVGEEVAAEGELLFALASPDS